MAALHYRHESDFVGRDQERKHLRALIKRAEISSGSLVLVSGEAGIGKTSLVQDLIYEATDRNWLALQGGCYDLTSTPPYGPWFELLESAATGTDVDKLLDRVQEIGDFRASENQQLFFEGMLHFLQGTASQQPIIAVLEDLHWSDPDSLDLLRFVGRRISTLPILLIVTYRDDELTRRDPLYRLLPALVREAQAERIRLGRLTGDALRELVDARYDLEEDVVGRFVEYLERTAEGNPLFIQELLRTLEERRIIRIENGTARLGSLDEVPVPELVQQLIDLRVDELNEQAQDHLEIASAIGQTVPVDLWASVASAEPHDLFAALEQGAAASILSVNDDGTEIRFTHALLREALYERIFPPRRRDLHGIIGRALADTSNPDPGAVANHFERAGDPRAVKWIIAAGDSAARTTGNRSAVERYNRALALLASFQGLRDLEGWVYHRLAKLHLTTSPEDSARYAERAIQIAKELDSPALQVGASFARAEVAFLLGESINLFDEWIADWETLDSADRAELDSQLRRIDLSTTALLVSVATYTTHTGRYARAQEILASIDAIDEDLDTASESHLLTAMTYAEAAMGHPEQAREVSRRRREKVPNWMQRFDSLQELNHIALVYYTDDTENRRVIVNEVTSQFQRQFERGNLDSNATDARLLAHELFLSGEWQRLRKVRDIELPNSRFPTVPTASVFAGIGRHEGNRSEAWKDIDQHFPDGPATGHEGIWFDSLLPLQRLAGDLAMDDGELDLARAWIEANQRWLDESGRVQGWAENHLLWARYYDLAGDRDAAQKRAELALKRASDPRQPLALLAAKRLLGRLAVGSKALDQAEDHLTQSLELASACAAPFEKALTLVEVARLQMAKQDRNAVRVALDEARSICERLGAQPTLDVIAELEHVAARSSADEVGNAYSLSPRELEVLQLLVDGRTDREIAEVLFISPRTVMSHVANIRNKLGVDSRTAAAGIAIRERLV